MISRLCRLRVLPALAILAGGGPLLTGCSSIGTVEVPAVASQPDLHSLCDRGASLAVRNTGRTQSGHYVDLLLSVNLMNQPLGRHLDYATIQLDYAPKTGLRVTATGPGGVTDVETIPPDAIRCEPGGLTADVPVGTFMIVASPYKRSRQVTLQASPGGELLMHMTLVEKGLMLMVIPLKTARDAWAVFPAAGTASAASTGPPHPVARIGECPDLTGTYSPTINMLGPEGDLGTTGVQGIFFRAEVMGDAAPHVNDLDIRAFRVSHQVSGAIELGLVMNDGSVATRRIEAEQLVCDKGHWLARGATMTSPAWGLLLGSATVSWEDLEFWRDGDGALRASGIYKSRGVILLLPGGNSQEMAMRIPVLVEVGAPAAAQM